jgi:hypothetical protein
MTVKKLMSIVKLGGMIVENVKNATPILNFTMVSVLLPINVRLDNGKMEINNVKTFLLYVVTLILQQESA